MLRYDFEMFLADDPLVADGGVLKRGQTNLGQVRSNQIVAFFRDQATADAVTSSPPVIRLFLEEVGFGLSSAGRYVGRTPDPAARHDMQQTLIAQLKIALANKALKKALIKASRESEFDVGAFISAIAPQNDHHMEAAEARRAEQVSARRVERQRSPSSALRRQASVRPTHTAYKENTEADFAFEMSECDQTIIPRRPSDIRRKSLQGHARQR